MSEVVSDRDVEPLQVSMTERMAAIFGSGLLAAQVDPVLATQCDRAHGVLRQVIG